MNTTTKWATAVLLATLTTTAAAKSWISYWLPNNAYMGVGMGITDMNCAELPDVDSTTLPIGTIEKTDCDDNNFAWKLIGGAKLREYWGLEAAYYNFSDIQNDITATALNQTVTTRIKSDYQGFGAFVKGYYPMRDISVNLTAKLGFVYIDGDLTLKNSEGDTLEDTTSSTVPAIGIGLEYTHYNKMIFRAGAEYFNDIETLGEKESLSLYNLEAIYKIR